MLAYNYIFDLSIYKIVNKDIQDDLFQVDAIMSAIKIMSFFFIAKRNHVRVFFLYYYFICIRVFFVCF